jgi:hypothetical protein
MPAWRQFRTILAGKAVDAGRRFEAMPPADTSQDGRAVVPDGSRCLQRVAKSLSVRPRRTHVGPCAGLVLARDEHAAQTLLRAGQARQARPWPAGASVVYEAPA